MPASSLLSVKLEASMEVVVSVTVIGPAEAEGTEMFDASSAPAVVVSVTVTG